MTNPIVVISSVIVGSVLGFAGAQSIRPDTNQPASGVFQLGTLQGGGLFLCDTRSGTTWKMDGSDNQAYQWKKLAQAPTP